jgi:hypothetical protein
MNAVHRNTEKLSGLNETYEINVAQAPKTSGGKPAMAFNF